MMKEIKYRAWHKKRKTMCHFDIKTVTKTYYPGYYHTDDLDGFDCELDDPNLYTELMQYTGLKDKNGVEIYEGDIIKNTFGRHVWLYLVKTDECFGGNNLYLITRYRNFSVVDDETVFGDFYVDESRDTLTEYNANKNLEVIGNTYENGDLLETS